MSTRAIQVLTESAKAECINTIKGRHRCLVSDKTRNGLKAGAPGPVKPGKEMRSPVPQTISPGNRTIWAEDARQDLNVVRPPDMGGQEFKTHWKDLSKVIEAEALKLDGTISAEHGVGRLKRDSFLSSVEPAERDLMRRLKSAMDPDNAMNPGVIL